MRRDNVLFTQADRTVTNQVYHELEREQHATTEVKTS
jgi:hypothetical protein